MIRIDIGLAGQNANGAAQRIARLIETALKESGCCRIGEIHFVDAVTVRMMVEEKTGGGDPP